MGKKQERRTGDDRSQILGVFPNRKRLPSIATVVVILRGALRRLRPPLVLDCTVGGVGAYYTPVTV